MLKLYFLGGVQLVNKFAYDNYGEVTCIYTVATNPLIWTQTQTQKITFPPRSSFTHIFKLQARFFKSWHELQTQNLLFYDNCCLKWIAVVAQWHRHCILFASWYLFIFQFYFIFSHNDMKLFLILKLRFSGNHFKSTSIKKRKEKKRKRKTKKKRTSINSIV